MKLTTYREYHVKRYTLSRGESELGECVTVHGIREPSLLIWSDCWGTPIARITDRIQAARILKRWRAAVTDSIIPRNC